MVGPKDRDLAWHSLPQATEDNIDRALLGSRPGTTVRLSTRLWYLADANEEAIIARYSRAGWTVVRVPDDRDGDYLEFSV